MSLLDLEGDDLPLPLASPSKGADPFDMLPNEVIVYLIAFLPTPDLLFRVRATSRRLRQCIEDGYLWRPRAGLLSNLDYDWLALARLSLVSEFHPIFSSVWKVADHQWLEPECECYQACSCPPLQVGCLLELHPDGTFVGSAIRAESWYDGSDYPGPPLAEWSTVDSFSLAGWWTIRSLPDALQRQDSRPGLATSNAAHHTLLCGRCDDDDECPTCLGRMRDVPAWSLPIALQLNGSADVVDAAAQDVVKTIARHNLQRAQPSDELSFHQFFEGSQLSSASSGSTDLASAESSNAGSSESGELSGDEPGRVR